MSTQAEIARTNERLKELQRQAAIEKEQELEQQLLNARHFARMARDEELRLRGEFFKRQAECEKCHERCAKIEAELVELAEAAAAEDFPTSAELAQWDQLRAKLEHQLNAARAIRQQAKERQELARDDALKADGQYVHWAQVAQNLRNQIDALREKRAAGVV